MVGKSVISDDEDELNVEEEVGYGDPVEDEAEEEEEEEEEEDEEDEEGQDEYEKDDFIVDDVEDEEEDEDGDRGSDDERQKKKKKRKKRESERNYLLDEDDYELLQENDPRPKFENKKFKRLKKAQRDAEVERSGFSDEEEFEGIGRRGQMAEDRPKRSLFGDEGQPLEDQDLAEGERPEEDDDVDEDDMADFIVEEEDDVDEHGVPMRKDKSNRKKSRKSDLQSDQVLEGMEIFGDVEELIRQRKQSLAKMHRYDGSNERSERRLEHEFEPIILSEKYMTEKDDRIREIDIPERMQLSEESTGLPPTDEFSLAEEATWIYSQLASDMRHLFSKRASIMTEEGDGLSVKKDDIMRFLELTHVQKLDVPFISIYRKEDCMSLLEDPEQPETDYDDNNNSGRKSNLKWHKVLWAVHDLDKKWLQLQKRKNALQSYYDKRFDEESRRDHNEARLNLNQQLFESITDSLKAAETEREVEDVDAKFNLHFPPGEVGVDEGQFKRPKRKSQYNICSKAGLWEVTNKFGYSSEQFGLLISLQNMRLDELEDARETPEEMASRFTCMMFESPQEVLKGARHMAAVEISCEPCVRKHVRSIFMENAMVSTNPTSEGNVAIDAFHQYAGVKWLKDKPVNRFEDAQWLLIQKAEEDKLLQVTIKLPEKVLDKLISDSNDYYVSDGVSKSAQLWNEQRKLILQVAFSNFLLPSMEKETRALLTSRAKHWLVTEYGSLLWNKVSVGPYHRKETENNSDEEAAPRVMACCWGPGKPATTFVMLDSSGEVQDVLYAGSLSLRGQSIEEKQRKTNDQQRVQKFMVDNQPDVVVLGAVNLSCARLKEDIYEIIFKMVEDNPRDVYEMDNLNIVYGDESLPHLYENSRISSDQLPAQSGIVKRAVALGRYLQNPLAMVATLCGPGREILSWKLSQLESFLTPDEKYDMIEQVMVDVTNQVGLDVNLAASHEWLFAPLQFISGLGPRKASSLQRSLVRSGAIFTRKDLLTAHGLGKKVFVNAVGFLRVRRSGLAASSSQFIDLLDDTRIHPESYGLAQDLAKDVYNLDVDDEVNEDDDLLEMAIEHVREKPQLLKAVNAYEYAEQKNRLSKKETLNDIRLELIHGFQDWRKPYVEPNPDEEFCMITGETEETLFEGKIVQVTVRRVQPQRANCVLDSGLNGMLTKEDYTDNWRDVNDLTEKLREGDMLTCRVKSIQKGRYQVFLSCRESDMRNERHQNTQNVDPYYHEDRTTINTEQDKARKAKELAKRHFKPRMIVHPRFQNISADDAVEFLSAKDPGECVIRPSSRGPSYLTLTLKICDGVYAHKDIVEGGKEHKDINSLLRIGKTLKIGDDTFEDLDEVIDRYVDPLVTHLKTMLSYRKFRKGNKAEVDELLRIEKSEYPMRIVYGFGIFHEHPGTFILTYIRSSNPHHEYIGMYPKGFKFRKRMFEDLDRLVSYFQRHIDDPHDSAPSIQSVAAMVPMRSPAVGGSSGFGGGWGGDSNDGKRRGGQDRDGNSGRGSRGGRSDYRGGNNQDGTPRSYGEGGRGRGRGRGRDSYGGGRGNSSSYDNQGSDHGGDNRWGSFPGAKVQKSPGREAFPTRWDSVVEAGGGGNSGGWGEGSSKKNSEQNGGGGGW